MEYINAEKLIADIKRKIENIENCPFQLAFFGEDRKIEGELIAYKDVLSIINSLQQEQSLPCWIHANYSDKPEVRYTPSGVPYLQNGAHMIWLSDLETLPKDGTDLTNLMQEQTESGSSEKPNDHQPEVDLEKEIEEYCGDRNVRPVPDLIEQVARHFYELGRKYKNEITL